MIKVYGGCFEIGGSGFGLLLYFSVGDCVLPCGRQSSVTQRTAGKTRCTQIKPVTIAKDVGVYKLSS